jgi:hypothetical protein
VPPAPLRAEAKPKWPPRLLSPCTLP